MNDEDITTPHPSYTALLPLWSKMRDVAAGEEAVKDAGDAYLPRLGGQENEDYEAYKTRAMFFEATGRTLDAMTGLVFRKDPEVDLPTAMEPLREDVDLAGRPITGLAEELVEEVLTVGVVGVLVDYPDAPEQQMTQSQAMEAGYRAFPAVYKAESITNWELGRVGSRAALVEVRLLEREDQYRVLRLHEGQYIQDIWQRDTKRKGKPWVHVDTRTPLQQGQPMSFIPFTFITDRDLRPEPRRPQLTGLANVNLSHYRTIADLEHGAHFTALPTPWAIGVRGEEVEKGVFDAIGPDGLWVTTSETAQFGMLEYTGAGLASLENRAESKEQQMATLGARLLAPEKRQVEAAETAHINRAGETSVLASIANSVSRGLTRILGIMRDWDGIEGEVRVQLNTDFMPMPMNPQMLVALTGAVQQGQISRYSYIRQLQRGEIVPQDEDPQEEMDRIEEDGGSSLGLNAGFEGEA